MQTVSCNPGATISLSIQVLKSDGSRSDGYAPTIDFVKTPSNGPLSGFPLVMTNISTGLFKGNVTIPSGISSVGTYIASVSWTHPTTSVTQYEVFLINAFLAFGTASVSSG